MMEGGAWGACPSLPSHPGPSLPYFSGPQFLCLQSRPGRPCSAHSLVKAGRRVPALQGALYAILGESLNI